VKKVIAEKRIKGMGAYRLVRDEELEEKARIIIREIEEAFHNADVEDTIWYDSTTTLLEEVMHRIEKVFREHHH